MSAYPAEFAACDASGCEATAYSDNLSADGWALCGRVNPWTPTESYCPEHYDSAPKEYL